MLILDGQKLAKKWEADLLKNRTGHVPDLAGVLVGTDPSSVLYLKLKEKMARRLGIGFRLCALPASASQARLKALIDDLNADAGVGGIIVQLPLPDKFVADEVVNWVDAQKDVDGLSDAMIHSGEILPATAAGIVKMISHYKIKINNQKVVLVGFSRLLNIPLSIYFSKMGAEVVVLQEGTKDFKELKSADVIVTAVGKRNLIRGSHVKEGVVVFDAGIVKEKGKIYGDVDFVSVGAKSSAITPVPGGVGPMTLVALLSNLITLAK